MAADLHALLTAAEIPPPYVLAGHSIGGIVARRFCARHPEAVAGIVLLDSSHENQMLRTGGKEPPPTSGSWLSARPAYSARAGWPAR